MRLRLIAGSVVLFIVAFAFNIFFNLTSLDKLYIDAIFSQHRVIAKDLQRALERGLFYGKSLDNFYNIEGVFRATGRDISKQLARLKANTTAAKLLTNDTDIDLYVVAANGSILFSNNSNPLYPYIPEQVLKSASETTEDPKPASAIQHVKHKNAYFSVLPLSNRDKNWIGAVVICLNRNQVDDFLQAVFRENSQSALIALGVGILVLIVLLCIFLPNDQNIEKFSKRKTTAIIFFVIGSTLVSTCGHSTFTFAKYFLRINQENSILINAQLKRDIESLLKSGARIDRLAKLDVYLGQIITQSPEIENITLFDHTEQPLYRATKKAVTDFQRSQNAYSEWVEATKPIINPEYNVRSDLFGAGEYKGYLSTNASKDIVFAQLIDNVLDSLTVIIISMLFFVEMLILIFKYIERRASGALHPNAINYGVMRPAAFLFLFGIDISVSFLPLHIEALYVPILNLSKETIMGLPISVEFLFVGISILISGVWLDRRGWHEPFLAGILITSSGVLYSSLAVDAYHFIISRAIVGLGYGLSLMAAQGFVIHYTDWKTKAQGLAHLFAGIYAGSICGTATGGMLAEWIGYRPVFLIGALILLAVILYTFIFMRNAMAKPIPGQQQKHNPQLNSRRVFQFLFNRTILGLIFFSSLPAAIAVIGFLNYFSPIYLNHIGASQSTIGQVIMLYGICLIYFGPFVSRYVDASNNKKVYILVGCVLGSLALLTFHLLQGLVAAIVAVLLLSLSSCFVLASQSVYALKLKVTQQLGEGKAIGIFRSTSRAGQMAGPIVFSATIAATNINTGITFLGMAYLATALLFLIFTQSDLKAALLEDL